MYVVHGLSRGEKPDEITHARVRAGNGGKLEGENKSMMDWERWMARAGCKLFNLLYICTHTATMATRERERERERERDFERRTPPDDAADTSKARGGLQRERPSPTSAATARQGKNTPTPPPARSLRCPPPPPRCSTPRRASKHPDTTTSTEKKPPRALLCASR
jgi:hypothetical protein